MPQQLKNQASINPRVLTIGHSNHTVEHFVSLLKAHSVQVVVDERSQPYSKYATQFDQEALKPALLSAGIRYLYLGRELGGRPKGDDFYDLDRHVLYDRVAATTLFHARRKRLRRSAQRQFCGRRRSLCASGIRPGTYIFVRKRKCCCPRMRGTCGW